MSAAIMCDAAVAARGQEKHLVLKSVRAQRPAVAEGNGLTRAPIIVINLRSVFGSDRAHAFCLDAWIVTPRAGLIQRTPCDDAAFSGKCSLEKPCPET